MSYQIGLNGASGAAAVEHKQLLRSLLDRGLIIDVKESPLRDIEKMSLIISHDPLPNGYERPTDQWMIETGGNLADRPPSERSTVGRIAWETLMSNIEHFLNLLKDRSEPIDVDAISALYAIDPKLEELLKPFATSSPFKAMGEAKAKLDEHVTKKLLQSQA